MRATEELRNDHEALRIQLARLEEWLPLAQVAPLTLQIVTGSIARRLREHTEREERLLSRLRESAPERADAPCARLLAEHAQQRGTTAVLMELLRRCRSAPIDQLVACASNAITGLREQMAYEELRLFPALDQCLSEQPDALLLIHAQTTRGSRNEGREPPDPAEHPPQAITSDMTVEEVSRVHPRAQEIFRAFGINAEGDQHRRLYGLEWRRDIDVEALTLALNQSIGVNDGAAPLPRLFWNACDGVMVIDGHRRVLAMNPAMERLTGRNAQDVVGQGECGTLLACQSASGCAFANHPERCPGLKALRRQQPIPAAEYIITTGGGQRLPVATSYTPLRRSASGTTWALIIVRNNAAQKRRERLIAHQVLRDALTGLPNRAALVEACSRELARAVRHHRPLAMAIADLDGLKAYNDAYGHLAGDELLKSVAGLLRTGRRATELVGRYGGDAFIILLPETGAAGAVAVADRVRQAVMEFPFAHPNGGGAPSSVPVTLSAGVATSPEDGSTLNALLSAADERLYEAKRRGRNQVVGSVEHVERRQHCRLALEAPMALLRSEADGSHTSRPEGTTKNLSRAGVYGTILPWKPFPRTGEVIPFAITIPAAHRRDVPYSQLFGHGRIVRLEDLPETAGGIRRIGLALAFGDDLTMSERDAENGVERANG